MNKKQMILTKIQNYRFELQIYKQKVCFLTFESDVATKLNIQSVIEIIVIKIPTH